MCVFCACIRILAHAFQSRVIHLLSGIEYVSKRHIRILNAHPGKYRRKNWVEHTRLPGVLNMTNRGRYIQTVLLDGCPVVLSMVWQSCITANCGLRGKHSTKSYIIKSQVEFVVVNLFEVFDNDLTMHPTLPSYRLCCNNDFNECCMIFHFSIHKE